MVCRLSPPFPEILYMHIIGTNLFSYFVGCKLYVDLIFLHIVPNYVIHNPLPLHSTDIAAKRG